MADIYGYARVSSKEQNLERQIHALREFGIPDKFIFADKAMYLPYQPDYCRLYD